jgi:ribosomal protein L31
MKKDISTVYNETAVTCACGNSFTVMSNNKELHIETCDKCHPFYNGGKDAGASKTGRIEKFNRKYGLNTEEKSA